MMTTEELTFVSKRARLLRTWPWVGAVLLVTVLGLWGYMFFSRSLLMNPWVLLQRLEGGIIPHATLAALAVLGSMGFLCLGVVMVAVIGLLWASARNEQRLLAIIQRLDH
jgi:hypothetical protein